MAGRETAGRLERSPAFDKAVSLHRAGNIAGALELYRQLLGRFPDHADLLFLAGSAECQAGNPGQGVELLARHLQINPGNAAAHSNRSLALLNLGRLEEALAGCGRAIELQPDFAAAHGNRGHALRRLGRLVEAITSYDNALRLKPDWAEMHFGRGAALQGLRKLDEALASFDQAVALRPRHAAAFYGRGHVLRDLGRLVEAAASYDRAIALNPDWTEACIDCGVALQGLKRFDEALARFDKAVALTPRQAAAHSNRGLALQSLGRAEEALASYDTAIGLKPDFAEVHFNRGNALRDLGRIEDAITSYATAADLKPGAAEIHFNRGNALRELARFDEALASFDRTVDLKPDWAQAQFARGVVLETLKRFDEALACFDRVVALDRGDAAAWTNRGLALQGLERLAEALASCDIAIDLKPGSAEAHYNRANVLRDLGRFDDALADYGMAIEQKADFPDAYFNRGLCRMQLGDFRNGLKDYEWRRPKELAADPAFRPMPLPAADRLSGKTIFVCAEQGFGDTIQFCRYLDLLHAHGATVLFAPQKRLRALVGSLPATIVDLEDRSLKYDRIVSLLSLPLLFGTTLESIPSSIPYLSASADRVEQWRDRLGNTGFKIGICWQGSPDYAQDRRRSFPARHFARLSGLPGVRLISLHKGSGEDQLADVPPGLVVETLGSGFDNGPDGFVDTAAVMMSLDLVVTSDTAIAHLAGALGVRTWLALSRLAEWRWLLARDDSPWYPTMRLFRQKAEGDWEGVFEEIATALRDLTPGDVPTRAAL